MNFTANIKGLYLRQIVITIIFILAIIASLLVMKLLPLYWITFVLSLSVLYMITVFIFLPQEYKNIKYSISATHIVAEGGLFFRQRRIIIKSKIILYKRISTPLTSLLHLSDVEIVAPGLKIKLKYLDKKTSNMVMNYS